MTPVSLNLMLIESTISLRRAVMSTVSGTGTTRPARAILTRESMRLCMALALVSMMPNASGRLLAKIWSSCLRVLSEMCRGEEALDVRALVFEDVAEAADVQKGCAEVVGDDVDDGFESLFLFFEGFLGLHEVGVTAFEQFLGVEEVFLGAFEGVDIDGDAEPLCDAAFGVADGMAANLEPFVFAVMAAYAIVEVIGRAALDGTPWPWRV